MDDLIEPTPEERKNGWTADALTRYVTGRKARQGEVILDKPEPYPTRADNRYDPHRW